MATIAEEPNVGTKKSGKGANHGVTSEVCAFFTIQPGHTEELRAACKRFESKL